MNLFSYPLLADENIHPDVILQLRAQNVDVSSVRSAELAGQPDTAVLEFAHQNGRVVLTHDRDFGTLAIAQQRPFIGIIYLRPGHIQAEYTLATLAAIEQEAIDVEPPFIIVAVRQKDTVNIRVRQQ